MSGLIATGFEPKPVETILAEIEAQQRTDIDENLDTSAESPVGQLNAIMASKLAELWELGAVVYSARDPQGASFQALDSLCAITGTDRRAATKGTVRLTLTVAATTTIPAGVVAHVIDQPTNRWETLEAAVNGAGIPAAVTVNARATETGRKVANAGTITSIATPTTGWTAVTNAADATPGEPVETDAQLRVRREEELSAAGNSTLEAIHADVTALVNDAGDLILASVLVDENASAYLDALGRPPKSIEVVLQMSAAGLLDVADSNVRIAEQLWLSKPGGIEYVAASGGVTLTHVDSIGVSRTVKYSSPTTLPIFFVVALTVDPAAYAGDAAAKQAIADFGGTFSLNQDVIRNQFLSLVMGLDGVVDATVFTIGTSSTDQSESNILTTARQLATFDTGDITLTSVSV